MNYRTIQLTDIAVPTLKPFKVTLAHFGAQDHSRWVFRGALAGCTKTFFYKIWNPSYVRRDNILAAIESGFYDERLVPALWGLITHKGLCRGYVMHEGRTGHDALTEGFRDFVFLRTRETGYFAVQFARCHTMIYERKLSLLDLEAVYSIDAFNQLPQLHCQFDDSCYGSFVEGLYKEMSSNMEMTLEAATRDLPIGGTDPIIGSTPLRSRAATPRFRVRLSRRVVRNLRNLVPRVHLIEY